MAARYVDGHEDSSFGVNRPLAKPSHDLEILEDNADAGKRMRIRKESDSEGSEDNDDTMSVDSEMSLRLLSASPGPQWVARLNLAGSDLSSAACNNC